MSEYYSDPEYSADETTQTQESTIVLTVVEYKNKKIQVLLEQVESKPDRLYKVYNHNLIDPLTLAEYLQEHWNLSFGIAADLINNWNRQPTSEIPVKTGLDIKNMESNPPKLEWKGVVDDDYTKEIRQDDPECRLKLADLPDYLSLSGIEKTSYSKAELITVRDLLITQIEGVFGVLLAKPSSDII
jgi:hypothetical protein